MENHITPTGKIFLETLGDDSPITVTLSAPTKGIGMENKELAPTIPCNNQIPLEAELNPLKSFVPEEFSLIKKSIQ